MELTDATPAELLILSAMTASLAIVIAIQFRPEWRHRFWWMSLLIPLVPYRLFVTGRRPLRLEYRDFPEEGCETQWRDLSLRIPRSGLSWLWNPALLVYPIVFDYAYFLVDETKANRRKPSSARLAWEVVNAFVAQQPHSGELRKRIWRLVADSDREGAAVLFESEQMES